MFAFNTQQYDMGVLWLRKKLRDACGGGVTVDFKQMEKEFTTVKEVAGLSKHGPQRVAAVQPLAQSWSAFCLAWFEESPTWSETRG